MYKLKLCLKLMDDSIIFQKGWVRTGQDRTRQDRTRCLHFMLHNMPLEA